MSLWCNYTLPSSCNRSTSLCISVSWWCWSNLGLGRETLWLCLAHLYPTSPSGMWDSSHHKERQWESSSHYLGGNKPETPTESNPENPSWKVHNSLPGKYVLRNIVTVFQLLHFKQCWSAGVVLLTALAVLLVICTLASQRLYEH